MSSSKGKDVHEGSSSNSSSSSSALIVVVDDHNHHQQQQQFERGDEQAAPTSSVVGAPVISRYESQKRRDWYTFGQYLRNQRPPLAISQCNSSHVLEFLRYLDQFGKTKVHLNGCGFFGEPEPAGPCTCPLRQAWGSLDALIGRLRAAYEENGGSSDTNPFASGAIRVYLREVRDSQSKARGIPYKKKKKKKIPINTHQQGA
ncbi:protein LIGHT-DEPENDENT SHORT HYPOCOTYLS 10 [Cucumis sativus]|uniref:ALOG domain-containing protein n=1 Tax=Cucumis sativus TaxID=3659 RepID=A0A0A0L028_CUCSA|nr:protein LIGHT-DEPENDENT SHORT HYPOCOTYLS 10 [Cucumis sativus]KGN55073.1 hypothetical protein Csa_012765 [Cucumis sativus]